MARDLFLGLDIGTSGAKLIAFDAAGREVARAARSYALFNPAPGMFELDPEAVWQAIVDCFKAIDATVLDGRVAALAIAAQGEAVIPLARDGTALAPSPVSADTRGAPDIVRLAEAVGAERIGRITGQPVSPLPSLAKILWWRRERPELHDRTWKYLCYGDFALLRLGITPVIDPSTAARMLAYDIADGRWSEEILGAADVPTSRLPDVVASGTIAGVVPDDKAAALRLPSGVVVVIGGHDQPMGALGAGVTAADEAMYGIGTTEALVAVLDRPQPALVARNIACYPHVVPERFVALAGSQTGARVLRWCTQLFDAEDAEGASYADLPDIDATPPPDTPIFLAHLAGSGSVLNDPSSTGTLFGLTFETGHADLMRAILEGVTFEQAIALEALDAAGIAVKRLRAVGGGARSTAWLAMKADILDRPITRIAVEDAPCLGAAILGSVATGCHASVDAATAAMVTTRETVTPRADRHAAHAARLGVYRALYEALRPVRQHVARAQMMGSQEGSSWAR